MKIDIHNHFYPENFLKELDKEGDKVGLSVERYDGNRQIVLFHGSPFLTITEPMINVGLRLKDMAAAGLDMQVLTFSAPGVDLFPIEVASKLSRVINEDIARICHDHPENFKALGTVPCLDPDRAVAELEYCVDELGFKGITLGTNVNGIRLDDPILFPLYERLAEYKLPIHLHPRPPVEKETFKDYLLMPMIGFEMDICVAVVRLIFGGILDKFPDLNFIVPHLGGGIHFLVTRINDCYRGYPERLGHIKTLPENYLKRFYYDTVSFYEPALMCTYKLVGAGRLILGSDYPHVMGDRNLDRSIPSIEELAIPEQEKEMIFSGNLLSLIG